MSEQPSQKKPFFLRASLSILLCYSAMSLQGCGSGSSTTEGDQDSKASSQVAQKIETDQSKAFSKELGLQGVTFEVSSTNSLGANKVTILPSGLTVSNDKIEKDVTGNVYGAEVGDLDADGSPEIYVYVRTSDEAATGSIVAYSANKGKSLSEIYLPPLGSKEAIGYFGHDEFSLVEQSFGRRFPIYDKQGSTKSGKIRQIQYKLAQGEAGWVLEFKQVSDI